LVAAGEPGSFAYRRAGGGRDHAPGFPLEPLPSAAPWVASETAATTCTAARAAVPESMAVLPPAEPPERAVSPPDGDRRVALLEEAAKLANQGKFSEAVRACEQQLRMSGLDAPAYYLMGMICQAAGDRRRAEDCFHKVVYLDPRHDEALLSLALLAERRGDVSAASGFRRRAERLVTTPRK
jgi:chemotaxis protein methyltransferase WspC